MTVKQFFDKYTLGLSMLIGAVGFPVFRHLTPILPPMIGLMLFFTFCKVNPLDLRLHVWHWAVLAVQIVLTACVYYGTSALCRHWDVSADNAAIISQGLMVCFVMPTATAAPIIAGKLGGSIQNLTTFTLLSNAATTVIVPVFFPLVNPMGQMTFLTEVGLILRRIAPLLLLPFFAAWMLRLGYNGWQRLHGSDRRFVLSRSWAQVPFYLWAGTLVILMGDITFSLLHAQYNWWALLVLLVGSLIACLAQFFIGKAIGYSLPAPSKGKEYEDVVINPAAVPTTMAGVSRITAGQALGQKNTTLGIWMCQVFLNPLAAIGPAAYIFWQNIVNAMQLYRAAKVKA
ncbi:MAG: hypothetical protein IJQ97_03475 [Paludibacteraceae bacterium]|nr:hypothetical protein [Paludibacteraceae bacterium]